MKTKLSLTRPAYEDYAAKKKAADALQAHIEASLAQEFERRGGCKRCLGRGWIVADDSRGIAYAEYEECPECTEADRTRVGLLHPSYSRYDKLQDTDDPLEQSFEYPEYSRARRASGDAMARYQAHIDAAMPEIGDRVVVVHGPKSLRGVEGELLSIVGEKVFIREDNGTERQTMWANIEALVT